jgi:hypothetical protein
MMYAIVGITCLWIGAIIGALLMAWVQIGKQR